MKNLVLIALSTLAAASAHAWEPEVYVGANVAFMQYNHNAQPYHYNVNMLEGVAGLKLIENLAIEARAGAGLNTARDTFNDSGTTRRAEAELGGYGGLYLKPMLTNETASLYGLLGYTTVELENIVEGAVLFDDSEGDLSYGIGVSFALWEKAELTAEYRKLINAEDFDIRGGSIGFIYEF